MLSRLVLVAATVVAAASCNSNSADTGPPTTSPIPISVGACLSGSVFGNAVVVPCDSPDADLEVVRMVGLFDYDFSDPDANPCEDDEVAFTERVVQTDGPLTGASRDGDSWCAVPIDPATP